MTALNPFLKLEIDLNKITSNYQTLQKISGIEITAVLKADAYGVGSVPVSESLFQAGCRKFFVATIDEALSLRSNLPSDAIIYIFNGFVEEHIPLLFEKKLTPILTTVDQINLYKKYGGNSYFLHFDTGMNRLSLPDENMQAILDIISPLDVSWVMSHLASADEPNNPQNQEQLERFKKIISHFPTAKYSLMASKGINLGKDYYFHQMRPGIYLYGLSPSLPTSISNKLHMALRMRAQILETKIIKKGEGIGYNATYKAEKAMRIATIALGYADGIPVSYSNKNHFWLHEHKVPIVGRVSMDLTMIDITGIPESISQVGEWVDLIHDPVSFYEMSKKAGSSPHEMLTRLGQRYNRTYKK